MGANAQTTVPTFVASQVLTADQMNQSARTGIPVFASTVTRDAGFGGTGEKTLAEGQLCYVEGTGLQTYNGTAWVTWGAAPSTLQVVQATYSTSTAIASTSYTDTGLTASITPTATSSKVLVIVSQPFQLERASNADYVGSMQLLRGVTSIFDQGASMGLETAVGASGFNLVRFAQPLVYLDSPSTTSSTTYKTQAKVSTTANSARIVAQVSSSSATMTLIEVKA